MKRYYVTKQRLLLYMVDDDKVYSKYIDDPDDEMEYLNYVTTNNFDYLQEISEEEAFLELL